MADECECQNNQKNFNKIHINAYKSICDKSNKKITYSNRYINRYPSHTKKLMLASKMVVLLLLLFECISTVQAFCPRGCNCNDISVDCSNAELDVVPILLNPLTMSITLANNKIVTIEESLLFYTELTALDLSANLLVNLGVKNFEGNTQLKTLSLNDNKLSSFQVGSFSGLSKLKFLSLNNNQLTYIGEKSFTGLDSLQNLYLENNRIRELANDGFVGLPRVRTISLMGNKLENIPTASISNLQSLEELNLGDNRISIVPESAFQNLANLSYLDMSRNNISLVHPNAFIGLSKLRLLNLRDNRINIVPNAAFPPLQSLTNLDLSGNLFPAIPRDFLGHLPSLQHLKVERCPRLTTISQDAFVSGWSLMSLSFSENTRLRTLPPAGLANLLALETLDLSSCGIETFQPTQVPMKNLKRLDISGNPLSCNCSLMWLVEVVNNHTFAPGRPSCAAPPALYGVPINNLGAGTCSTSVGVWTIAGCVGVALSGLLIIVGFLICRYKKRRTTSPPTTISKPFQICTDDQTRMQSPGEFTNLSTELPHVQQIYSSGSYYSPTAPPNQFMYNTQPRQLHSCPPNCSCTRQSPALRPLLRSTASTPTQSHILNNTTNMPPLPNIVDFPPPPPTRPPPTVSIAHLHRNNHYHYSPQYLGLNNHHLHQNHMNTKPMPSVAYSSSSGSPNQKQLLSADWLYGAPTIAEDNPQHWYASIDGSNSSQSAGAGNESSGYWEEDKELPTSSLLPNDLLPKEKKQNRNNINKDICQENKLPDKKILVNPPEVVKDAVPTSYI